MFRIYLLFCFLHYVTCIYLKNHQDERLLQGNGPYRFPGTVEDETGSELFWKWNVNQEHSFDEDEDVRSNHWRDERSKESAKLHFAMMGHPNKKCDDGRTNLEIDWDGNPTVHTCYQPKVPFAVDKEIKPLIQCDKMKNGYLPKHVCMDKEIKYKSYIPTHESHRPLWAMFGEYVYVPPQRWLHNVEHGAIVMLYHPCAEPAIVNKLKNIVKSCIRKHVISADTHLINQMPFALVAWGCRLMMNDVDVPTVVRFIKEHGLTGPEGHLSKDGQYNLTLIEKATIPEGSDRRDSKLCPAYS